jgi:DNA polymerase-3 subunit delta
MAKQASKGGGVAVFDLLAAPPQSVPAVCVVYGEDAFLRHEAVAALCRAAGVDAGDGGPARYEGDVAGLAEVLAELRTLSLFGGRRVVVVANAERFVSQNRAKLEDYVQRPAGGVLILELEPWPANTRLYAAVAARGLAVCCDRPPPAQLKGWLVSWAASRHGVKLSRSAAELLVDLVGGEPGILHQELGKLAAAAEGGEIGPDLVERLVGSWRERTAWEMIAAAFEGRAAEALDLLDRLLAAGESELAVLGPLAYTMRLLAAATRHVEQSEAAGRPPNLRDALLAAGSPAYPPMLERNERYLRRLGRERGRELARWVLQAELDLKGDSRLAPRLVLERLLARLAAPRK